jgi:hypothetical protein
MSKSENPEETTLSECAGFMTAAKFEDIVLLTVRQLQQSDLLEALLPKVQLKQALVQMYQIAQAQKPVHVPY